MDEWGTLDLLLRGIAVGAQLGLGIALGRSAPNGSLKIAIMLFIIANVAFTLNGSAPVRGMVGEGQWALWLVQLASAAFFWMFALALFEDQRFGPLMYIPAATLLVLGLIGQFGSPVVAPYIWTAHNVIGLGLAAHALLVIVRSASTDLVEARRQLRVPFLVLVAGYSLLLSVAQIGQVAGLNALQYEVANAAIQAFLGIGGVAILLSARESLFGALTPALHSDKAELPEPHQYWLDRLENAMAEDRLWQREGLTIADLAECIGLPEHRLRRLINDQLGYRNFAAFINQRRIQAAKAMLSDPTNSRLTVASIAFDLGFGSLGPFNRAFREATGFTPTDYRKQAMGASSPISEMSG